MAVAAGQRCSDRSGSSSAGALDFAAMGRQAYDITRYQPVLFAARSMTHLVDALADFYSSYQEEAA